MSAKSDGSANSTKSFQEIGLVALISLGAFLVCFQFGMTQYPGYDAGFVVNLAHRLYIGQLAGHDFFSPAPPFYSLLALLSFRVLSPSWLAFSGLGALAYVTCSVSIYLLFRSTFGRALAALVALLGMTQAGLLIGFWWHGAATTLFAMVFAGVVLLPHQSRWHMLLLSAASAVLMGLKPNMAFPMLLGCYLCLAMPVRWGGAGRMRAALLTGALALAVFFLYAWAARTDPLVYLDTLKAISSRGHRMPLLDPVASAVPHWGSLISLILLVIPVCVVVTDDRRMRRATFKALVGATCIGTGVIGALTNGDFPLASFPLVALGVCLIVRVETLRPRTIWALFICWSMAAACASWLGFTRERILAAGVESFWENPSTLSVMEEGFFKGASVGPALHGFIIEAGDEIKSSKAQNVFFGPRTEFGYAQFNLPPPKGMPLWFDPGTSWDPARTDELIENWTRQNFDLVILLRNDVIYIPPSIIGQIKSNYVPTYVAKNYFYASTWLRKDLATAETTSKP